MQKVATWLFVGLALLILVVGVAMASNMCPWGDDPQEMVPPITTGGTMSTVGMCDGVVGASHYTGYHMTSEGVTGNAGVAGSLLSVGRTQYARQSEFTMSDMGLHLDAANGLDVQGKAYFQESAYNEVLAPTNGDLTNCTPVCIFAADEIGGILTQGMVGSQVGLINNPSAMSLQMQAAVGPSEGGPSEYASGAIYTRSSIHTMVGDSKVLMPTVGLETNMQDSTHWMGNFQMVHQFSYGVSNLGSLSRDLSESP